jgi:hypothetical protein
MMEDLQYSSVSGIPSLSSSKSIEFIIPSPSKSSDGSIPPTVCACAIKFKLIIRKKTTVKLLRMLFKLNLEIIILFLQSIKQKPLFKLKKVDFEN